MFEPKVAWVLAQHWPVGTAVFVANSMPVRDAEYVRPADDRSLRLFCNRGANGIDETLSTALGVAHGTEKPAVLLTGDLALLHDTNGFLLRPKFRGALTIVVINNRGGGFRETLRRVRRGARARARLGALHGIDFDLADLPGAGLRVLELRTDRKRDAAARKALFTEIAAGLA